MATNNLLLLLDKDQELVLKLKPSPDHKLDQDQAWLNPDIKVETLLTISSDPVDQRLKLFHKVNLTQLATNHK